MKVFVSCILVLLAASYELVESAGERGGRCKGRIIPTVGMPQTVCETDCKISLPVLPGVPSRCNDGLKCCLKELPTPPVAPVAPEPTEATETV